MYLQTVTPTFCYFEWISSIFSSREKPAASLLLSHTSRFAQAFVDYSNPFDSYFTYIQNRPKSEAFILSHAEEMNTLLSSIQKARKFTYNLSANWTNHLLLQKIFWYPNNHFLLFSRKSLVDKNLPKFIFSVLSNYKVF